MHFAIVEDLKIDQNHLIHLIQENLEKHGETVYFDCYESGEAFLEAFRPRLFNAVFMDIMLDRDGRNGIDTALELRKREKRLPIVFTTTERDYSLQGYRAHPLDYLLKPVEEKALAWCLDEIRTFRRACLHRNSGGARTGTGIHAADSARRFSVRGDAEPPADHPYQLRRCRHTALFFGSDGTAPEGQSFLHERTRAAYQFFTCYLGGRGRFCPSEKR